MDALSRPPREDIYRALHMAPILERSEGAAMPTLTGHFAVWDQWTEINSVFEGRFMERFAPTSMNKTLAESRDQMRVLFNHGHDPQIGDKVLGSISELEPDGTGARYSVPMFDTSYNRDLIPALDAGVYGASFRFKVVKEEFNQNAERSAHNPDALPERTVTEARVMEFGPVTFPAYAGATAGLRSVSDEFLLGRYVDNPDRLMELVEAIRNRIRLAESWQPVLDNADGRISAKDVIASVTLDGETLSKVITKNNDRAVEPEPSEATTQTPEKPERSVATTFRATGHHTSGLFTTTRKEKPQWRL